MAKVFFVTSPRVDFDPVALAARVLDTMGVVVTDYERIVSLYAPRDKVYVMLTRPDAEDLVLHPRPPEAHDAPPDEIL